jgi:hypothetical protein
MKKILLAAIAASLLTGSGHNVGTVIYGKFINLGYDPELNKVGIQYVDGIMATGLQKELSESHLVFADTAEKDGVKTSTTIEYGFKNGEQITGYGVDAIEAMNKN